jgi:CheY-like chemotaxis protein
MSNAVKSTPAGGRIHLSADLVDGVVEVAVADTGPGIAPEEQEAIFEEFQQGRETVGRQEGTGLGLPLSRRLIELHGGRLWVDSIKGGGSTFRFTLPVGPIDAYGIPAAPAQIVSSQPSLLGAGELVLIVDDNEKNRRLARNVLGFAGFRTIEVANGADGVSVATEHLPDVILMDIRLPDMDGTKAVQLLKSDPRTARIPVVALTSLAMKGDREWFLAAGFDGYLEKPISVREFPAQVQSYVPAGGEPPGE